jgi:hypothetical protein
MYTRLHYRTVDYITVWIVGSLFSYFQRFAFKSRNLLVLLEYTAGINYNQADRNTEHISRKFVAVS